MTTQQNETTEAAKKRFLRLARSWAKDNDISGALDLLPEDNRVAIGREVGKTVALAKRIERAEEKARTLKAEKEAVEATLNAQVTALDSIRTKVMAEIGVATTTPAPAPVASEPEDVTLDPTPEAPEEGVDDSGAPIF